MYQWYQIMVCLLKFDFFCFAGVTMQVGPVEITGRLCPDVTLKLLILVLQTNSAEFGLTIAAIPIVLILLVMCGFALKREIKWSGCSFCYYQPHLTTK